MQADRFATRSLYLHTLRRETWQTLTRLSKTPVATNQTAVTVYLVFLSVSAVPRDALINNAVQNGPGLPGGSIFHDLLALNSL